MVTEDAVTRSVSTDDASYVFAELERLLPDESLTIAEIRERIGISRDRMNSMLARAGKEIGRRLVDIPRIEQMQQRRSK